MKQFVSIPFEREGVCKVNLTNLFQDCWTRVSIPFEREGVCKALLEV